MARARQHAKDQKDANGPGVSQVVAYLRVSTDEQAQSGLGLGDQRTRCEARAAYAGWPAPVVYADEGISGTKEPADRPALARLLADTAAGQVDVVIVSELSRLARKTRMVLELVEELDRQHVTIVSCKEDFNTATVQGKFCLRLFAALAEMERDLVAERTRDALRERGRRDGERGGRLPYGYRRAPAEPGGIAVDPEAAAVVRRIFALQRRGESLRQIAERIRKLGVPGPRQGGTWHHSAVDEVLKHRAAYAGGFRGESSTVRWPAILGAGRA